VNSYIAEFWNSFSNIVIVCVGLFNLRQSYKYRYEPRYALLSCGVALVGFGSFAFHGMLQIESQFADELPMIYSILIWCYCLYQIESTANESLLTSHIFMVVASLGYTVVHCYFALVTAFQLYFALLVTVGVVLLERLSRLHTDYQFLPLPYYGTATPPKPHQNTLKSPHTQSLRLLVKWYFLLLLSGLAVWLIDQNYCTLLHNLPYGLPNPQLHAWWHAITGMSHHFGIQFAIGLRLKFLNKGKLPVTRWHLGGVWPVSTAK